MRPKVVIATLVAAICLVGVVVAVKGLLNRNPTAAGSLPETQEASVSVPLPSKVDSNAAAINEQVRAADIQAELERIRELQADGASAPTTGALLGKLVHREPEVRRAALEALVQLNDTNAIPAMEQTLQQLEDAREKVALMEAIEYLKLPEANPAVPPASQKTDTAANAARLAQAKVIRDAKIQELQARRKNARRPGMPAPGPSPAAPVTPDPSLPTQPVPQQ